MVNNSYKETYVIFLMYEHVFSMLYEDGSSLDTRHRLLRQLDTPLLCHQPFTTDRESAGQTFSLFSPFGLKTEFFVFRDGGRRPGV